MIKPTVFGVSGGIKRQIAAEMFSRAMTGMKTLLKAGEWKFDGNIECEGFKWYKSHVMDQFYPMLEEYYLSLEQCGLIEECGCGASIKRRNGWRPCQWCQGSGYKNSKKFNDFMTDSVN